MVSLMGGRYSEGYQLFTRLTVKAFLAIRPHADQIVETARLMLGTGLPSFKGEGTIQRLRDRFAPGLGDRQAAEFMMTIVKNAHENVRSIVYDEFQRVRAACFRRRFDAELHSWHASIDPKWCAPFCVLRAPLSLIPMLLSAGIPYA